jgi:hypothetical protein
MCGNFETVGILMKMTGTSACTTYANAVNFSPFSGIHKFSAIDIPFLFIKLLVPPNGIRPAKRKGVQFDAWTANQVNNCHG